MEERIKKQKKFYQSQQTKDIQFRLNALKTLDSALHRHEKDLLDALGDDLNKSSFEGYLAELALVYNEIHYAKAHLRRWMKRRFVFMPLNQFPSLAHRIPEPKGVVFIISPWNYPVNLTLIPLVGAIAAGNCCLIKPSSQSTHVLQVLSTLIREAFPSEYIDLIDEPYDAKENIFDYDYDHIFFTGGVATGKYILETAAKHLTPVTLELGGKSPCIVDETANIKISARRIIFGKYLNAGQTCIAPDYLYVQENIKDELVQWLIYWIEDMYSKNPLTYQDYPKIINDIHFQRMSQFLNEGHVLYGGEVDSQGLKISPTLIDEVSFQDHVMKEEIFGPVFPILTYKTEDEMIAQLQSMEKPLALYAFSKNQSLCQRITDELSFGGGCQNDTIIQLFPGNLPFGGMGQSGMGQYHGKYSFMTFSHIKSFARKGWLFDVSLRYHPYTKLKERLMRFFI